MSCDDAGGGADNRLWILPRAIGSDVGSSEDGAKGSGSMNGRPPALLVDDPVCCRSGTCFFVLKRVVREGENGPFPQVNHWFVCLGCKSPIVF